MREANSPEEQAAYNDSAVAIAEQLTEARRALMMPKMTEAATIEERFGPLERAGMGVALEYERMGNQPVTDGLNERADRYGFAFEHLGITIGTIVHGIDLKGELDADLVRFIRDVLLERKVVCFRDQHLDEDEQVAFGKHFGELDAFPFGPPGDNPYIVKIQASHRAPARQNLWHTDVTWMEKPSLGSIAQCIEVPPIGGDTLFSDSHAVYLGLPKALSERIQHLHGINDYRVFLARDPGLDPDFVESMKERIPFGVSHPLCRTHPETGKTALYIHGGFLRHDSLFDVRTGKPLPKEEAEALVASLLTQHSRPEYICRYRWEPGSIAFWDNRAVQHYAACDYFPHRRLLQRVTVSGDRPFYNPDAAPRAA